MRTRITANAAFVGAITHEPVYSLRNDISGKEDAWRGEVVERLLQYEDMFFEKWDEGKELVPLARLRELADAEREGRVVVTEAKQGAEIFDIKHGYVRESKLNEIKLNRNGLKYVAWWGMFSPLDIGETVFMTQAEADRALAATEPKGDYNHDQFRDSMKKVTEQPQGGKGLSDG